ncbi:phage tail protein [Vibrio sp. TRT 17S01]|uniref:phage tail protein n=1 Tax=Vibrio sp. TRT 17S01 TaxID=3418505 RepID=UPI003CEA9007
MKSDPNEFISVQPESRTLIEESLEYGWHRVFDDLPNPFPDLKNPQKTPDEFVALLAGERAVLDWQPGDTSKQQRDTTDNAFGIHSKAGTRGGLKSALGALGFSSEIRRGAKPYSLDVQAEVEKGALTVELQHRLSQRVTSYKSERDSTSMDLVRSAVVGIRVGCLAETGVISDSKPFIFEDQERVVSTRIGVMSEVYIYSDSRAAT